MRSYAMGWMAMVALAGLATAQDGPIYQWQFTPDQIKDGVFAPQAGPLPAAVIGPPRFSKDLPKTLILDGNPKIKPRLEISKEIARLGLPTKAITAEAWVKIEKTQEWGGIIGAFQDNGPYEKGWLLGYHHQQFNFAVASKGDKDKRLTYLDARAKFQPGFWYHLVGTYDGVEQRLYVDGKLQAGSKIQSGEIDYPPRAFFTVGAYHDDDELYPLTGQLERVSVFARALSAEEVAARFKERKGQFPDMDPVAPRVTDWPTQMRDNLRRGITEQTLQFPLNAQWVYQARHGPRPAWPEEAKNDYYHKKYNMPDRVIFDRAFHVVGVGDRIFFGSSADDRVTCLHADTGKELWSYCTEGPVRLAPTVFEDRLVFGSDDGHVYCLAAKDGALVWKQRLAPGPRRIPGNERVISAWPVRTDVLVEEGKGYVCAGVFPSQGAYQFALDLADGKILERQKIAVTAQGYLQRQAGKLHVGTGRNPAGAFVSKLKRLGRELDQEINLLEKDFPYAFIGAGNARLAGGDGKITAYRVEDGAKLWSTLVEGKVESLSIVRGRLVASTDRGLIYCFTPHAAQVAQIKPAPPVVPADLAKVRTIAARILERAKFQQGYCLVLGSGDGRLVYELARQSRGQILGLESDPGKVAQARQMLADAGLGHRAVIHQGPLDELPYTDYLFNLVVSNSLVGIDGVAVQVDEAKRVLRPGGGMLIQGFHEGEIYTRPSLTGAGEWPSMYGDPGNSACSKDQLVQGELSLQWFGRPSARPMIDRHHRTVPPIYKKGLLFVPGDDKVIGVDAYNGTILWERDFKNSRRIAAFRDSSYLAAGNDRLFVAAQSQCHELDPQTGETIRLHGVKRAGGEPAWDWGYLASVGNILVGSAVRPNSIRREQNHLLTQTETHWDFVPMVCSDFLFARQGQPERELWSYRSKDGLILNPSIAIAGDNIYFLESTNRATLNAKMGRLKLEELVGQGCTLKALNLKTGEEIWRRDGQAFANMQHVLYTLVAEDKVVIVGTRNSGPDKKKDHVIYDIHVFHAHSGKPAWSRVQPIADLINGEHGEQDRHPVIVDGKLYCEPNAYDLATGQPVQWQWPWKKNRRGCGTLSASAHCFFFRDETVTSFDLTAGQAKPITAETRPGCWINLLPVGGMLVAPEASSGCSCNHSVQTSLALIPARPAKKKGDKLP